MSRKKILLPLTKRHTHRQALALPMLSVIALVLALRENGDQKNQPTTLAHSKDFEQDPQPSIRLALFILVC